MEKIDHAIFRAIVDADRGAVAARKSERYWLIRPGIAGIAIERKCASFRMYDIRRSVRRRVGTCSATGICGALKIKGDIAGAGKFSSSLIVIAGLRANVVGTRAGGSEHGDPNIQQDGVIPRFKLSGVRCADRKNRVLAIAFGIRKSL